MNEDSKGFFHVNQHCGPGPSGPRCTWASPPCWFGGHAFGRPLRKALLLIKPEVSTTYISDSSFVMVVLMLVSLKRNSGNVVNKINPLDFILVLMEIFPPIKFNDHGFDCRDHLP